MHYKLMQGWSRAGYSNPIGYKVSFFTPIRKYQDPDGFKDGKDKTGLCSARCHA
jgi:hypothetical protein